MTETAIQRVLERLKGVRSAGERRWKALCPAHDDHDPSLAVSVTAEGAVLLTCFAGCPVNGIVKAMGLEMKDLFDAPLNGGAPPKPKRRPAPKPITPEAVEALTRDAEGFRARITRAQVEHLARTLGVRPDSLDALGIGCADEANLKRLGAFGEGWKDSYPAGAYAIPERDAARKAVGFSFRPPSGGKGSPSGNAGARRGLIIARTNSEFTNAVLVAEGASDVAAALTMGLEAVGRPSCDGGAADLAELLEGREILVVGENDQKPDGSWPGLTGARRVASKLAATWGVPVRYALPPSGFKDIRAWLNAKTSAGLDISDAEDAGRAGDEFMAALLAASVEEMPPPEAPTDSSGLVRLGDRDPVTGKVVLSPKRTLPTAAAYVREFHTHSDGPTLVSYAGTLWEWRDNRYMEVEDEALRNRLFPWLHEAVRYVYNPATQQFELEPFEANPRTVGDSLASLRARVHLDAATPMPAWLGDVAGRPSALEILPCRTLNLHLPSRRVLPATPALFTTTALDFDYRADAPPPTGWIQFLKMLWGSDEESISTLQEWMGYTLVADTSQQKILLLVGPKRSGKGTIARIIKRLVGLGNVAGPTTASLAGPFGLQGLLGKTLAIISDARFSGESVIVVIERLLCISGEDAIGVDRKFLPLLTKTLPVRFMLLTNEVPRLTDASSALAGRFIVLRLTESFYGREDHGLTDRLLGELPGILRWAIEGWHRLRARGHFLQPESGRSTVEDLEDLSSPVGAFVRDRCLVGPGYRISVDELYEEWKKWCAAEGRTLIPSRTTFGKDLSAAVPSVTRRRGSGDVPFYDGIRLKDLPF